MKLFCNDKGNKNQIKPGVDLGIFVTSSTLEPKYV